VLTAALVLATTAFADDWDLSADADNGNNTDNAPAHGSEQVHDLRALPGPVADQDWYRLRSVPLSSYQFVVDGMTGDLDLPAGGVQRVTSSGALLDGATVSDGGGVLSVVWFTAEATGFSDFVRVQGAGCGTACTAADTYRARLYDTTYTVPRFNNSGTQVTALVIQNVTDRACTLAVAFLDSQGTPLDLEAGGPIAARGLAVVDTSAVVPDQSGSVRVLHTCGYGGLAGKAVSVEPATGFTFDTPFAHRPR
jgi:hypothetical protein